MTAAIAADEPGMLLMMCPCCQSDDLLLLPAPHPAHSMVSDGRIVAHPLLRASCNVCGYGFRATTVAEDDPSNLYDENYELGLHDVAADEQRAEGYAAHIAETISNHFGRLMRPINLVEFGCGTGALLASLGGRFSVGEWLGVELAEQLAVAAKVRVGPAMSIMKGYAETGAVMPGGFDACVSVNVIEHSLDPLKFLSACKTAISPGGLIVIVCPEGSVPGTELLFLDHMSDFSVDALSRFARRIGLSMTESRPLQGAQSGFRLSVFEKRESADEKPSVWQWRSLNVDRHRYLSGWRDLGESCVRALSGKPFVIFGIGEFYDLLRAYAPDVTTRAKALVADNSLISSKDGHPIISTGDFIDAKEEAAVLAAVNPRSWRQLRDRLVNLGLYVRHPFEFCDLRTELN